MPAPSKKKPTSQQVAALAGVSQSTVSFVMNQREDVRIPAATRQRVIDAALALGYSPPSPAKKAQCIGIVVPTLTNPFYPKLIGDVEEAAAARGIPILIMNSRRNLTEERLCLDFMRQQKVRGLIFSYTPFLREHLIHFAHEIPVVVLGEEIEGLPLDTLSFSSVRAGEIVANHLIGLGHREIAFLSTPIHQTSHSRSSRLTGIKRAMQQAKLAEHLHIFIDPSEEETSQGTYEMNVGYQLGLAALNVSKITAIICVNDITAAGTIKAAEKMGRKIPGDIAIAGFDNLLFSSLLTPPLTSVEHHTQQRARMAIDILLEKAAGKGNTTPLNVEYHPTLIVRASTDPNAKQ